MSDLQTILAALGRLARRMRLQRVLRLGSTGLLWGSAAALVLLVAHRLLPLADWLLYAVPILPLLGAVLGACLAWRTPGLNSVARHVDQSARLEERLSTAVELANAPGTDEWRRLVLLDAAQRVKSLDEEQLVPLRLPRSGKWSAAVLALCVTASFVPAYRSPAHNQRQADALLIRETGRQLAELTRQSLEKRPPGLEPVRESLDKIADAGLELERNRLTRTEALQDLSSLADKLQERARDLQSAPEVQRLEHARHPDGGSDQRSAEMRQRLETLRQQLGGAADASDRLDSLRNKLESLAKQAQALSSPGSAGNSAAKANLGAELAAAAREARDLGIDSAALDGAIAALAASQPGKFVKDMQQALTDLDNLRELSASMRQLESQLPKLGQNLSEQLQAGQIEAAQKTLEEMNRLLQAANLSPEQLQKMLKELSQAVGPAGNYGQVGQCLQGACQQLQAGQKVAAASSLAAAIKELASLQQQLGDIQQLAAALQNLKQASACISSGKCWGACRNPGMGQGQKPGSGVGTWAADGLLSEVPQTAKWDNSGIKRPNLAPRGLSDRGSGEGSTDGLKPDQVRGQMSRGAPMPSITLKGLSIKGQSRVTLEEAAASAQEEAQSALSQERVPRAYQGPVRDYFNDLKQ